MHGLIRFVFLFFFAQSVLAHVSASSEASKSEPSSLGKSIQFEVTKHKLKNGLTVLIHEDHRTPLVSFHQWYRVGSVNERPGITGISHFFEHLMFKGTKKFSGADFERLIQENGGTNNAFTTYDYTGYYVDLPAKNLEVIMDIESDRMTELIFDLAKIQSEREVVKEERRYRLEDRVEGYVNEALFGTVFKVHPYRWPIIGSMKDLNSTSLDQLKSYYKTYYSPNNSVLVVAGAVNTKKVLKLVKKYYGKIPSQKVPKLNASPEPQQKGQRSVSLVKNVQNPFVAVGFKAVEAGHKDQYAFDLLSNILSEGDSSRLHKKLVYRDQLLSSVTSWAYTPAYPGIFQVFGALKPGKDPDQALKSIYSELYKMRTKLVSEKELQKAKNQVMKSFADSLKTVSQKARGIASNEILFGDYRMLFKDIEKYNSVTREDVKRVAATYLQPSQRSVIRVKVKSKQKGR